jgi:hypothetical protein
MAIITSDSNFIRARFKSLLLCNAIKRFKPVKYRYIRTYRLQVSFCVHTKYIRVAKTYRSGILGNDLRTIYVSIRHNFSRSKSATVALKHKKQGPPHGYSQ